MVIIFFLIIVDNPSLTALVSRLTFRVFDFFQDLNQASVQILWTQALMTAMLLLLLLLRVTIVIGEWTTSSRIRDPVVRLPASRVVVCEDE